MVKAGVGGEPHFPDGSRHALGQALAAVLGREPEADPAACRELFVGLGPARRRKDLAVFEAAAGTVAGAVERRQYTGGELAGFLQHGIDQIGRGFLTAWALRNPGQARDFVEQEADVGERSVVIGHRNTFSPSPFPGKGVIGVRRCAAPCCDLRPFGRPFVALMKVGAGGTVIYRKSMGSADFAD
nr:hypothetical protein [Sulfuritalea sp.]